MLHYGGDPSKVGRFLLVSAHTDLVKLHCDFAIPLFNESHLTRLGDEYERQNIFQSSTTAFSYIVNCIVGGLRNNTFRKNL